MKTIIYVNEINILSKDKINIKGINLQNNETFNDDVKVWDISLIKQAKTMLLSDIKGITMKLAELNKNYILENINFANLSLEAYKEKLFIKKES